MRTKQTLFVAPQSEAFLSDEGAQKASQGFILQFQVKNYDSPEILVHRLDQIFWRAR